ncbi:Peptidase Do [Lentibacillus sp. JNUCC-1]|uniref:S1 family peptidase n=1 Tax=Lentibacillus sp. JNUCC-1 TaxID=2654513 RepID=UPI0012E8AB53|nr:serine protease [Lentibacillus sp. JNUCC-1]MUV36649.1 Peptidase Do [Lentibacillus sp. JNUCC-1]
MTHHKQDEHDIIDEDLYEEFDDEELYELVEAERQKALNRAREERHNPKPKRPFPKWVFWIIAMAMVLNIMALLPQTFALPVFDFIKTSASLSSQDDIQAYKKAVAVVETEDGRGTGFAISQDGKLITNHHVIEGQDEVTVAFPDEGLYRAEVIQTNPDIDLAILQVIDSGQSFPHLNLAKETTFKDHENVYFIGNPLRFQGIANEGEVLGYTELSGWEEPVLMIKAPIYNGNSGSPVIRHNGQVIGVVFATLNHDDKGKVGLVVPIDYYYKYFEH